MSDPILLPLFARDGEVLGYSIIDAADEAFLQAWEWTLATGGYVIRRGAKDKTTIYMHRLLLGLEPGDPRQGDHRNRVRIDNRRGNLRVVTGAQNSQNQTPRAGTSSRFRGVCWNGQRRKWMAYGIIDGRQSTLGHFDIEEDAAECARAWRELHLSHYLAEEVA